MTIHTQDDTVIINRIVERDQQALAELYDRHGRLVYNMALHVLQNDRSAEEVTQDVFFQVWRWPERWDSERAQLSTWLLAIARYTAIDYLRREQRRPQTATSDMERISNSMPTPHAADNATRDNGEIMKKLISKLPKDQRVPILMAYYRGMTHEEIAQKLNIPLGTAKSRIRLGMKKLKEGWLEVVQEIESNS
ncbi:MAG: sigma-70 family RNA polymerase sigma factor [Chloroflexota bacterium]